MERSGARGRCNRETSPDRAKVYMPPKTKPFRKVQIVYYLCRNGQLEQPHFMELTHLPNQQLRLRDVMDKLSALRGRAVTSLYSWSCKRTYRSGFVWNDLGEDDVIYPAEGVEYILKGSEILQGCTESLQHMQLLPQRRRQHTTPPALARNRHLHPEQEEGDRVSLMEEEEEEEEEGEEEEEKEVEIQEATEDPVMSGSVHRQHKTPTTRCSRGVSTEELHLHHCQEQQPAELAVEEEHLASPPSSSSSDKPNFTPCKPTGAGPNRFGDAAGSPDRITQARAPSVLLQLIACGSAAVKGRAFGECGGIGSSGRRKTLQRSVVSRLAASQASEDADEEVIRCMSEYPRFGALLTEDKEYFSGSIVEGMRKGAVSAGGASEPSLKRSSSYNEERSKKCGLGDAVEREGVEENGVKGKCIPTRKRTNGTKVSNGGGDGGGGGRKQ